MAIEFVPDEIVYHSNKAAVFFEMENLTDCVLACNDAIDCAQNKEQYDFAKLAKVLCRKGNAFL